MENSSYLCLLRIRINMVTFIGEYTARLDDKGRLVFPAPFKALLPSGVDQRFVIRKDLFEPCLEMYTYEEWMKQSDSVKESLDLTFNQKHAAFWREYLRNRDMVEPDPRFGRITISRKLLDSIGVNKEVVFSGNDFKIEIWSKENYERSGLSDQEFIAIAESLSKK